MSKVQSLRVIRSVAEMVKYRRQLASAGKRLGLVPTMGYLHQGHTSLVKLLHGKCEVIAASIFVNPMQFGPKEDFTHYPRDMARDVQLLAEAGCELVFNPSAGDMYPNGFQTALEVAELSQPLCGRFRSGHFRGVATVVLKLFNVTGCSVAAFGLKDYQQSVVIKQMVCDLNLDVDLVFGQTVREADGLAMSSRNSYLSPEERQWARLIPQTLMWAREAVAAGQVNAGRLKTEVEARLSSDPGLKVQYVEVVYPETLIPVEVIAPSAVLAVAVFAGKTRLIDNVLLEAPLETSGRA